jgi:hypothetical protein
VSFWDFRGTKFHTDGFGTELPEYFSAGSPILSGTGRNSVNATKTVNRPPGGQSACDGGATMAAPAFDRKLQKPGFERRRRSSVPHPCDLRLAPGPAFTLRTHSNGVLLCSACCPGPGLYTQRYTIQTEHAALEMARISPAAAALRWRVEGYNALPCTRLVPHNGPPALHCTGRNPLFPLSGPEAAHNSGHALPGSFVRRRIFPPKLAGGVRFVVRGF